MLWKAEKPNATNYYTLYLMAEVAEIVCAKRTHFHLCIKRFVMVWFQFHFFFGMHTHTHNQMGDNSGTFAEISKVKLCQACVLQMTEGSQWYEKIFILNAFGHLDTETME